jgi:signal transduction histidine kinase
VIALSVRPKLTIWYVGTVTVLLCSFIGADVVGLRRNLMSRARTAASNAAETLARELAAAPPGVPPEAPSRPRVTALLDQQLGGQRALGAVLASSSPGPRFLQTIGGLPPERVDELLRRGRTLRPEAEIVVGGEPFQLVTRRLANAGAEEQVVLVALSVADRLATWRQALWEHVLLALGLVLLVSFFTYQVIKRALAPVRRLTAEVRTITAEDLGRRVDGSDDRYEIGELAATFNEVIGRLESAFDRMRRFTGDVAHELKTPLSVLRAELDLGLRSDRSAVDCQQSLQKLREVVDGITGIVDNLLFLAKTDAQGLPEPSEPVALDDVLLEVYEELLPLAQQAKLRCEITEMPETSVRGDRALLRRLVTNLVGNAIKFSRPAGQVLLSLRVEGREFVLTVADDGIGIPAADLPHVFDRFYRVDKSRSKRTGGVGLGLAIAHEIARAHGFVLTATSAPHARTELRLTGPLAAE